MAFDFEDFLKKAKKCTACDLRSGASTVVVGSGNPKAKILFVIDMPGEKDDKTGDILTTEDKPGTFVREVADMIGLNLEKDVFITSLIRCRTENGKFPKAEGAADTCTDTLLFPQIKAMKPKVVICFGKKVTDMVMFKNSDDVPKFNEIVGDRYDGTEVYKSVEEAIALFHPEYVAGNRKRRFKEWLTQWEGVVEGIQDAIPRVGKKLDASALGTEEEEEIEDDEIEDDEIVEEDVDTDEESVILENDEDAETSDDDEEIDDEIEDDDAEEKTEQGSLEATFYRVTWEDDEEALVEKVVGGEVESQHTVINETCDCKGFKYRNKCNHLSAIMNCPDGDGDFYPDGDGPTKTVSKAKKTKAKVKIEEDEIEETEEVEEDELDQVVSESHEVDAKTLLSSLAGTTLTLRFTESDSGVDIKVEV